MQPEDLLNSPAGSQWKKVGIRPYHGIDTPLFSIRSKESSGIGEFLDLKRMIDWLSPLGFNVIQLLPIYATGYDPSPYNGMSANALHPIYLSLWALPRIENHPDLLEAIQGLASFNETEKVQYAEVKERKDKILKTYAEREMQRFENDPEYVKFRHENPWVKTFATFEAFKERYAGKYWKEWPENPDPSGLEDQIRYKSLHQFLAYGQMSEVKNYADSKHFLLLGDIPILISKDSADVWSRPELFNLDLAAGAPPDEYNKEGQKWGFPLYRYDALAKENFQFWKERLSCASHLYHLFRIDHIVGFFRIWGIPPEKSAKEGHFVPEEVKKWWPQGTMMLKMMLENSSMLPIGEDLGVIPNETRAIMRNLGISGTKVIFWERNWETDKSFIPFSKYPIDSLVTISTHDSETFPEWWKNHPEEAKDFAAFLGLPYEVPLKPEALFKVLKECHRAPSLFHINLLQEYLSLCPDLTWQHPERERINTPGVISPDNWVFRYKFPIEKMASHGPLNEHLRKLTA